MTLEFEHLRGKRLVADVEAEKVSSDGGLVLLRSLERKLGIVQRLCGTLVEKRRVIVKALVGEREVDAGAMVTNVRDGARRRAFPGG